MSLQSRTSEKVSADKLKSNLAGHVSRLKILQRQIGIIQKKESVLQDKKRGLVRRLREEEFSEITALEKLRALEPLSEKLTRARNSFLSVARKVLSKDITIRQGEMLEEKAKKLLLALQGACDHRFVLEYDGYEGSYSHDYEDQYPGMHRCVVCGLIETSQSCKEQIYRILVGDGARLVKRDIRTNGRPTPREVFALMPELISVNNIQKMFFASAGLSIVQ